jgi:YidC/Oxa1 family membrane protein insertase
MNEDNRNLIMAVVLAALVLLGWNYFVAMPQERQAQLAHQAQLAQAEKQKPVAQTQAVTGNVGHLSRAAALASGGARIAVDTPSVDGSLRLKGARFDDLRFKNYHDTTNPKSAEIVLLSPEGTNYPYYAMFGWVAAPGENVKVPDDSTPWKLVAGAKLTQTTPVELQWNNGQGLTFTRRIAVDDRFLFTVTDSVANSGGAKVTLFPYAYVARDGVPAEKGTWILHEGYVGVAGGSERDAGYDDFKDNKPPQTFQSTGGWLGFTDKYWMTAVVPPQNAAFEGTYRATQLDSAKAYQADYRLDGQTIAPGGTTSLTQRLFAGAKVLATLQDYEKKDGIVNLHYAVDWGWFWFFTQPIFFVLDVFYRYIGNFGIAIVLLTVLMKLAFFPLADASYRSMSRVKKLQPKVDQIRTQFAEDKVRQQQEMMELYKREKVNPVSGCLPMLLQIPVFFSLYKVLYVTIEMRQAPFYGWIHDLSAPDPTSLFNLFGLLPYSIPTALPELGFLQGTALAIMHVGLWPIFMGITQWVQMKMNPPAPDPVQQRMFAYMPLIFTFMLSSMPAGLVIYWTWNNLLSVTQQYIMMRRQGVEVHLFNNLKVPALFQRLGASGARAKTQPGE